MYNYNQAFRSFLNSGDLQDAINKSTRASWGGGSYSVELFLDGHYRVDDSKNFGDKYKSPGLVLFLPTLTDDEYSAEYRYYDNAIDALCAAYTESRQDAAMWDNKSSCFANWKATGDIWRELPDGTDPIKWINFDFSYEDWQEWFSIGGFDPERCRELWLCGLYPESLGYRPSVEECGEFGITYYGGSLAYLYCNGDANLKQIDQLISTRV